jgi:hypothetical protein
MQIRATASLQQLAQASLAASALTGAFVL